MEIFIKIIKQTVNYFERLILLSLIILTAKGTKECAKHAKNNFSPFKKCKEKYSIKLSPRKSAKSAGTFIFL